jgi:hypothetical protein
MTKYTTVFTSLLRYLSTSEFQNAICGFKPDRRSRTLTTWNMFKVMLYGQLCGCFSVREIIGSMKANGTRLYHAGLKSVKRSTFCEAMEKRNSDIFQSVFHLLSEKAQVIAGNAKKRFKDPLRIIDSSVISLCYSKFDWAKYRKTKGAVKLHMNLDGDSLIPFNAYISDGKLHDVNAMQWLCGESGVIYVLDRGYVDFKSLYCIELQGSKFVTRMKSNCVYKKVKCVSEHFDSSVIADIEIELTGNKMKEHYPLHLRKVTYHDSDYNRTYEFITNNFELSAQEIADIYKERWNVELFFKWIKQHLKVKTFWGTSRNAVLSQIWVALIGSILLWISRTLEGIKCSAYELLTMMRTTLLRKGTIAEISNEDYSPPPLDTSQPFLEGLLC